MVVGILGVVRDAVEPVVHSAFRIGARRQIAGVEHGGNARDVGLERQPLQVEVQLHVLVERFRDAGRDHDAFGVHGTGGLLSQRQPALDLADVGFVFIQPGPVARTQSPA